MKPFLSVLAVFALGLWLGKIFFQNPLPAAPAFAKPTLPSTVSGGPENRLPAAVAPTKTLPTITPARGSVLESVPSYLLITAAQDRQYQADERSQRIFPRFLNSIEDEALMERWIKYFEGKEDVARLSHAIRFGSFRYLVGERFYDATVMLVFAEPVEGEPEPLRHCLGANLYISLSAERSVAATTTCSPWDLRTKEKSFLIEFNVSGLANENLGERILIEVPYFSSGNQAVILEESKEEFSTASVQWRSTNLEEGRRLHRELDSSAGITWLSVGRARASGSVDPE